VVELGERIRPGSVRRWGEMVTREAKARDIQGSSSKCRVIL
jgi:hypothetical protein